MLISIKIGSAHLRLYKGNISKPRYAGSTMHRNTYTHTHVSICLWTSMWRYVPTILKISRAHLCIICSEITYVAIVVIDVSAHIDGIFLKDNFHPTSGTLCSSPPYVTSMAFPVINSSKPIYLMQHIPIIICIYGCYIHRRIEVEKKNPNIVARSTCVRVRAYYNNNFLFVYMQLIVYLSKREKKRNREREVKKSVPPYNSKTLLRGVNFFIDQKVFTF